MFISSQNSSPCFKDFTLVMPAVAVGNVGQLAVDLMVSTLNMSRVGFVHTDCLIPMAGNNPYASCKEDAEELHTAAEVYTATELKLAVLQIRAPIIQTKSQKFRQLLVSWIKASGFSRTVVLSSSHAYQRDDQQLQGTPLRYLVTPSLLKGSADTLKELGWREMERVTALPGMTDTNAEPRLYIPGGGITKGLYTDSCAEDVPLAVLLLFCSEGDNIPDAFTLVNHLNDWLRLLDNPLHKRSAIYFHNIPEKADISTFPKLGNSQTKPIWIDKYHCRAEVATNGRSLLPGAFCLAVASLQHCSDFAQN